MAGFDELKQRRRAMWASGDYDRIAEGILAVADHVVRSARIRVGERVLDVACRAANTALAARARGADGKVRWGREYLIMRAPRG